MPGMPDTRPTISSPIPSPAACPVYSGHTCGFTFSSRGVTIVVPKPVEIWKGSLPLTVLRWIICKTSSAVLEFSILTSWVELEICSVCVVCSVCMACRFAWFAWHGLQVCMVWRFAWFAWFAGLHGVKVCMVCMVCSVCCVCCVWVFPGFKNRHVISTNEFYFRKNIVKDILSNQIKLR